MQKEALALRDDVELLFKKLKEYLSQKHNKLIYFHSKEIEKLSLLSSENIEDFLELLPIDEHIKVEIDQLDYTIAIVQEDIAAITGMTFSQFEQELENYLSNKEHSSKKLIIDYFNSKDNIQKQLDLLLQERNKIIDLLHSLQKKYKVDIDELKYLQHFYLSDL